MTCDPRLTDVSLLTLAAMRARHRRGSSSMDWRHTEGLCALLEAARQQALPQQGPWELPNLEEHSGLARLLEEARQRQEGGRHGA